MQRLRIPTLLSVGLAVWDSRRFRSTPPKNDLLDDIFAELEGCETADNAQNTKTERRHVSAKPSEPESSPLPAQTTQLKAEEARNQRLQRLVKETEIEMKVLLEERTRLEKDSSLKGIVPLPAARMHLSSAELIAEKSPQHFSPLKNQPKSVPLYSQGGDMAAISLVGTVSKGSAISESLDARFGSSRAKEPSYCFAVLYNSPVARRKLDVVCFGSILAEFASNLKEGDMVHVLGELDNTDQGPIVCVLPNGGNISIVLHSETQ